MSDKTEPKSPFAAITWLLQAADNDLYHVSNETLWQARAELVALQSRQFECAVMLSEVAKHHRVTVKAGPDDPKWLIERGACSCGNLIADGVTPWADLWREHILALLPDREQILADFLDDHAKQEFVAGMRTMIMELDGHGIHQEHPLLDEFRIKLKEHDRQVVANAIAQSCKDPQLRAEVAEMHR